MSNVCLNCQQDRSANVYLCLTCGAPDLETTRALNAELFIQTIEFAGTFHAENQESRCVASYQKGVYTYSLGPQSCEVETVSFAAREALQLLEEGRDRVKHIVHPHLQGEHEHYGTLFTALSEFIEIVQLQRVQVKS